MASNDPYISKIPGDTIRSEDWNNLQVFARTDINTAQQGADVNASAIGGLQSAQAELDASLTALGDQLGELEGDLALATTLAPSTAALTLIEARSAPDTELPLEPDLELDVGLLRYGVRLSFTGLGAPTAAQLRRCCRVELDAPTPLGGPLVAEAAQPFALQTLSLDGVAAQVDDALVWEPRPAALHELSLRLFAAVAANGRSALLAARLIVEGEFVGPLSPALGRSEASVAGATSVAGGRFVVPFWLTVPYDDQANNQVPPADWPWAHGGDPGDFPGAFAGLT
ncbi:hypothetical protein PPSIR1_14780 [Plesiocystis pacifica SIR-1]|uniref:Uncharacterized protein n=1 Tax=Plesiocystis pacifica SIR-1 TaxID=391625 RepID=A6GIT6_9BACT|nr:hypothetical protein [Plesiocystis pacifica]EDM74231.1 hypothetical protein PPSIR1_14780 [Plesiocystis pacifica SIR-1]